MPKEIVEIQLKRNAAKKEPWGLRIGGGVDRGKVLVLEKAFLCLSCSSSAPFTIALIHFIVTYLIFMQSPDPLISRLYSTQLLMKLDLNRGITFMKSMGSMC